MNDAQILVAVVVFAVVGYIIGRLHAEQQVRNAKANAAAWRQNAFDAYVALRGECDD